MKRGSRKKFTKEELLFLNRPTHGIARLANDVACAMYVMNYNEIKGLWGEPDLFVGKTQEAILTAINDDKFLNPALDYARIEGIKHLEESISFEFNKKLGLEKQIVPKKYFVTLLKSAASLEHLELVTKIISLYETPLSDTDVSALLDFASDYRNPLVTNFLKTNLISESEKIKQQFLKRYHSQLSTDKGSWYGFYAFFAKSYVNQVYSLEKLVHHAQGLSSKGSGRRSRNVMQQMGLLDKNGQLSEQLSNILKN